MTHILTPRADSGTPLKIKASQWERYLGDIVPNHARSGLGLSSGGGLTLNVALGEAYVNGLTCKTTGTETISLTDAATNYCYIQLTRDGNGEPQDFSLVKNTTGIDPADSARIGVITTAGGAITVIVEAIKKLFTTIQEDEIIALGG